MYGEDEEIEIIASPLRFFAKSTYHGLMILSLVYHDHHHSHRFKPVAIKNINNLYDFVIVIIIIVLICKEMINYQKS